MISSISTGNLFGITVEASMPKGLSIFHAGTPATLAVLDTNGNIVAKGAEIEAEVFGVVLKAYDAFWVAKGTVKKLLHKPR